MNVPKLTFELDTYPFIGDSHIGKVIPVLYGLASSLPLICINENENPDSDATTARFCLPIGYTHTGNEKLYKKVDDAWKEVSFSVSDGILSASLREKSGSTPSVKMDNCTGYLFSGHSYPLDVIKHIFETQYGLVYNASNFNTSQFESELNDARVAKDISLYLGEKKEFWKDILPLVQDGCAFPFEVYPAKDGRITARLIDYDRVSVDVFPSVRIMNAAELEIEKDPQGVYSSVVVKFGKNHESETFKSVIDNTYYNDVLREYRTEEEYEEETLLVNADDAKSRAELMALRLSKEQKNAYLELEGAMSLDVYDVITVALKPNSFVENSRDFVGTRDCIVWSVDPDPETRINKVRVGIIDNRTPKESLAAIRSDSFTTVEREKSSTEIAIEEIETTVTENAIISMTSETTPPGTKVDQLGTYQNNLYQWDGSQWVKQEAIFPRREPVYRFDCDSLEMSGSEYTSPIIDNSGNGRHSIAIIDVTPVEA